jgi:hypothetical protein
VNADDAGSNPAVPPSSIWDLGFGISDFGFNPKPQIPDPKSHIPNPTGAVAERRMHFPVEEDDDGSSPFGPAISVLAFGFWILDFVRQMDYPNSSQTDNPQSRT